MTASNWLDSICFWLAYFDPYLVENVYPIANYPYHKKALVQNNIEMLYFQFSSVSEIFSCFFCMVFDYCSEELSDMKLLGENWEGRSFYEDWDQVCFVLFSYQ